MKSKLEKKYANGIVVLSILIPLAVAVLFGIKIPNAKPLSFLPPIYASINGLTAILMIIAIIAVKNGNRKLHQYLINTCVLCSVLFLTMYVAYHMTSDSTAYGGKGIMRSIYFFILITHIILSVIVIPFVLITYSRGILGKYEKHKKIARYTFPLWLYVAISGVLVYLMISPYYKH